MHTHQKSSDPVATMGLDIGKNTVHLFGLDKRGAIAMRVKVSRNQLVRLVVQAAHVVRERRPTAAKHALLPWIDQAARRLAHRNLLAIALANKLVRIAWTVLARGREYEPKITPNAA